MWDDLDQGVEQARCGRNEKQRDLAECDYDASKATTGDGKAPKTTGDAVGDGVVRGMEKSDLIKKCMRVRGYSG